MVQAHNAVQYLTILYASEMVCVCVCVSSQQFTNISGSLNRQTNILQTSSQSKHRIRSFFSLSLLHNCYDFFRRRKKTRTTREGVGMVQERVFQRKRNRNFRYELCINDDINRTESQAFCFCTITIKAAYFRILAAVFLSHSFSFFAALSRLSIFVLSFYISALPPFHPRCLLILPFGFVEWVKKRNSTSS